MNQQSPALNPVPLTTELFELLEKKGKRKQYLKAEVGLCMWRHLAVKIKSWAGAPIHGFVSGARSERKMEKRKKRRRYNNNIGLGPRSKERHKRTVITVCAIFASS